MKNYTEENTVAKGLQVDEWSGLYAESWQKLIVPDAFSHP
jgi:hypothetical protein